MVEFEIWLGEQQNALSIGSGIQAYKKIAMLENLYGV